MGKVLSGSGPGQPRPISKAERRALADALRHMRSAGVGRADRMAIAGRSDKKLAYSIPVSRGQA